MDGFLEVSECSETVCIYVSGKPNPAEGVRDLKKDHEWTIALFYPTVLTHSVVILLDCRQTVLTRLWYSEHPCEVGVHTYCPDALPGLRTCMVL